MFTKNGYAIYYTIMNSLPQHRGLICSHVMTAKPMKNTAFRAFKPRATCPHLVRNSAIATSCAPSLAIPTAISPGVQWSQAKCR